MGERSEVRGRVCGDVENETCQDGTRLFVPEQLLAALSFREHDHICEHTSFVDRLRAFWINELKRVVGRITARDSKRVKSVHLLSDVPTPPSGDGEVLSFGVGDEDRPRMIEKIRNNTAHALTRPCGRDR